MQDKHFAILFPKTFRSKSRKIRLFTKEIDGTHSRTCRSDLASITGSDLARCEGVTSKPINLVGAASSSVEYPTSRLLIVIICNRILISTCIAGIVHPGVDNAVQI